MSAGITSTTVQTSLGPDSTAQTHLESHLLPPPADADADATELADETAPRWRLWLEVQQQTGYWAPSSRQPAGLSGVVLLVAPAIDW